ncbi:MAG: hypothetical protein M3S32_12005 [Acidobacteriota bacterium]|nr:hypothetical protein [Acidobacteriota bacterium]
MGKTLMALFLFLGGAAIASADAVSEGLRADLARERRRLATDARALADSTRRLETALAQLSAAARAVADGATRSDIGAEEVARREDTLNSTEQEARMLLERRRILADRVVERRRSVAVLETELAPRKPDGVSGRWAILLDPGDQKGTFRMALDGTLVTGDYTLEGGYSGSLRGTLINDRLKVERVDSKLGFSTVYYGRIARDGRTIAGTWESTSFGTGGPGSGRWSAARDENAADENP